MAEPKTVVKEEAKDNVESLDDRMKNKGLQLPSGEVTFDEALYRQHWEGLGGALVEVMGENAELHSYDPTVNLRWEGKYVLQLPPTFAHGIAQLGGIAMHLQQIAKEQQKKIEELTGTSEEGASNESSEGPAN